MIAIQYAFQGDLSATECKGFSFLNGRGSLRASPNTFLELLEKEEITEGRIFLGLTGTSLHRFFAK